MASQLQRYTAAIAGQAVTLTPVAGTTSNPSHLGASTVVFNTTANPAPVEFWSVVDQYIITVEKVTP